MHSIKNNKPSKKSGFIQGYFPIDETRKYLGSGPIIYRSSWERKFCLYCERNPEIVSWSSESFFITYFNPLDNKYHKYFPDYIVTLTNGLVYIVEIKPKAQLLKPEPPKRQTPKSLKSYMWSYQTWVVNMCKKAAADEYAKIRGWEYLLVTEDFFKVKTS
jgi:hypothetical protein